MGQVEGKDIDPDNLSSDEETVSESNLLNLLSNLQVREEKSTSSEFSSECCLNGDLTLKGVADAINRGDIKNIIVMSGAGLSVAAGIPDFRTPGTGLYDNLQEYNLPEPQAIFDIGYFKTNPAPFSRLARELFPGKYRPTPAHYFIRLLHEKGLLLRNFTQNIDTLEREAGIDGDKIVEAHGSFALCHCLQCRKEHSTEEYKVKLYSQDDPIPKCECGGLIKPDIVFFGESLPDRFWDLRKEDFPKCDLLIVIGTSLKVQPFCGLIADVSRSCVRLLINREEVGTEVDPMALIFGRKTSAFAFNKPHNWRDVKWLGDIQDGVEEFVKLLGWEQDYAKLLQQRDAYEIH